MFVPAKIYTMKSVKLLTVALALFVGTIQTAYAQFSQVYPIPLVSTEVSESGNRGTGVYSFQTNLSSTTLNTDVNFQLANTTNYKIQHKVLLNQTVYHNTGTTFQLNYTGNNSSANCQIGYTYYGTNSLVTGSPTVNTVPGDGFVSVPATTSAQINFVVTSTTTNRGFGFVLRTATGASNCTGNIIVDSVLVNQNGATSSLFSIIDPIFGVSSEVNVSGGGSSGTTTVVTPNDDIQNFFYTFWIFMGITFIFSFWGLLLYFRKS